MNVTRSPPSRARPTQIVTQLAEVYDFTYPPAYARIIHAFRVANLHLFAWLPGLQPVCLGLSSLVSQLLFATLAPLVVVAVSLAVTALRRKPMLSALPFVLYWSFLVFPSVSSRGFRALATCDCFSYVDGSRVCFLREHLQEQCTETLPFGGDRLWPRLEIVAAAWLAIAIYGVCVPALYAALLLLGRRAALDDALAFLTKDYEPRTRWWELVEVGKKLLFTGFLALVDPGSLTQIYLAVTASIAVLVMQLQVTPYGRAADNTLAVVSEVALAFTLLGTLGLDASQYTPSPFVEADTIVAILIVAALLVIVVALAMLLSDAVRARARLLCTIDGPVELPTVDKDAYHIFLSHVWGTGQDQMRIIKQRLLEILPGVEVFLDVDIGDLKISEGGLEDYIDRSAHIFVYCSGGYFQSKNCMRELTTAVRMHKPLIALLEPDAKRGGLSIDQIRTQLVEAEQSYPIWGFDALAPRGSAMFEALFAREPIEWNRIGEFQDITMRLTAERALPVNVQGTTFLRGELTQQCPKPMQLPPHRYHIYYSEHNAGALAMIREVEGSLKVGFTVTSDIAQLPRCECFLILLDSRTWTGSETAAFTTEVQQAMAQGVRLMLCHEMPSALPEEPPARHAVEFGSFFTHTPQVLLTRGIYADIAITFKPGAWREVGIVKVGLALSGDSKPSRWWSTLRGAGPVRRLVGAQPRTERARVHVSRGPEGDGVQLLVSQGRRAIKRSTEAPPSQRGTPVSCERA